MRRCEVNYCPNFNGSRNGNDVSIRFHRFPSADEYRRKWEDWVRPLNKMGSFVAPRRVAVLCSAHFTPECYMPSMRLRRSAVPSIVPPLTEDVAFLHDYGSSTSIHSGNVASDVINQSPILEMPQVANCLSAVPTLVSSSPSNEVVLRNHVAAGVHNSDKGIVEPEHDENDSCVVPTSKKRSRIAFVGDLTVADFSSEQRAKRSLAVIQVKYKSMQTKVKTLRQALRRSREKIRNLESLTKGVGEKKKGATTLTEVGNSSEVGAHK